MSETLRNKNLQKAEAWNVRASWLLLACGFILTFVVPFVLLKMATDSLDYDAHLADQYSAWSFGLITLGPSLFLTSFLAMGSSLPWVARWMVRLAALALSFLIFFELSKIGEDFTLPVVLGLAGILYCWLVDVFTLPVADGTKSNEEPEKVEVATKADKAEPSAVSVQDKDQSEASRVVGLLLLLALLIVPVILDVFEVLRQGRVARKPPARSRSTDSDPGSVWRR